MAKRMLAALGDAQDEALEEEALLHAVEVLEIQKEMSSVVGWSTLHLNLLARIARSMLETSMRWSVAPGRMIEKATFDAWCLPWEEVLAVAAQHRHSRARSVQSSCIAGRGS